jgi:hypothetical protein
MQGMLKNDESSSTFTVVQPIKNIAGNGDALLIG